MAVHTMMPPGTTEGHNPITIQGRTYSAASGSTIQVPDFDAPILAQNGWTIATTTGAGATSSRPTTLAQGLKKGATYHDTTLGKIIHFDGSVWRDITTGSAA